MKRTIREDGRGFYVSVGGWIIRPLAYTDAEQGQRVTVQGGGDPTRWDFGWIRLPDGTAERWAIHHYDGQEETTETRPR